MAIPASNIVTTPSQARGCRPTTRQDRKGFRGGSSRATDATVYYVIEGRGQSRVGDTVLAWQEHDIFVVPSWKQVSHEAQDETILFSFSDRPVQKALGFWREQES